QNGIDGAMDVRANSADAALQALVGRLHATGRLRVWSLVITIFGDMIVPRGGRVALSVLQEITGRLGVEAGPVRTAMSRPGASGPAATPSTGWPMAGAMPSISPRGASTRQVRPAGTGDGPWCSRRPASPKRMRRTPRRSASCG